MRRAQQRIERMQKFHGGAVGFTFANPNLPAQFQQITSPLNLFASQPAIPGSQGVNTPEGGGGFNPLIPANGTPTGGTATDDSKDEGTPTWVWVAGGVAALAIVAYAARHA